jgi:hypothetical protein
MIKGMFYTKVARVVAAIAFVLGGLGVLMGFSVATGLTSEPTPGYYLGSKTSGQAIDRGIYYILFAIVVGVLSEISQSLSRTKRDNE